MCHTQNSEHFEQPKMEQQENIASKGRGAILFKFLKLTIRPKIADRNRLEQIFPLSSVFLRAILLFY